MGHDGVMDAGCSPGSDMIEVGHMHRQAHDRFHGFPAGS